VDQLLDEAARDGAAMALLCFGLEPRTPASWLRGGFNDGSGRRQPVERRATIRAWLPRGFVPPQVTIVSAKPSTDVLMVRSLGSMAVPPRQSGEDVLYWRRDIF
jgi:hypothetical protein